MAIFNELGEKAFDGSFGVATKGSESHEADIDRDAVEPRREFGAAIESVEGFESAEKGFLNSIQGIVLASEHSACDSEKARADGSEEFIKGRIFTGAQAREERGIGARIR